ncbi:MAG TPA: 2-C-methyl-D-erythritol 2,4-cyclodiphosphate synthase [Lachnospiraceae bacterium]|nr:2-C-methyl-D-erythritol 2,4-cyclodiphosphate synthase [Lachnospiraceae bacterium]
MRIGTGYDVHRLCEGRRLWLGGVEIPFDKGLLGHSDADVLLHAICDALLGAAALGDIGKHFPDTDESFKGISSLILLEKTGQLLTENGFVINNIDSTVIAQAPKLSPYIEEMKQNIADTLGLSAGAVNVKATTEEGLGFTGNGEGIAAQAVCLLNGPEDMIEAGNIVYGRDCRGCSGCRQGEQIGVIRK